MSEILEHISYEHNLRHSYMYIRQQTIDLQSYEAKLLRGTPVPAALPLSIQPDAEQSAQSTLQYEVSGLESMQSYYADRKLHYLPLARLMENIHALLRHLEEYLLPEDMVLLDPSAIFYDPEKESWCFTLVPGYAASFHESIKALIAWLLKRIDYNEDRVVVLAYTLYNESMKEFLVMENLLRICRRNLERERRICKEIGTASAAAELDADHSSDMHTSQQDSPDDHHASEKAVPRRMISTDGIFRPIDAGIDAEDGAAVPLDRPATEQRCPDVAAEDVRFPSDYGEDAFSKAVNTLTQQPSLQTSYDTSLEGVSIASLSEPEKQQGLLSFLSLRKEKTPDAKEKATLQDTISSEKKQRSFQAKLILSVALMLLIPFLIWFLKGAAVFRRMLPIIVVLEAGILVVIALDFLMARMPDDEGGGI